MYLIIIAVIIGIAISVWVSINDGWSDWFDYLMNAAFGSVIVGLIGLGIAIALPMDTYNKNYAFEIESLQDNNSIYGNFFLGIGQIEGKMKYVFYYKTGEYYRMTQIDYDKARIKYSSGKPRVSVTELCPTEAFINNFAIDCDIFKQTYVIEIPKGSIKSDYNLDAR